jgi:hypothetical protein
MFSGLRAGTPLYILNRNEIATAVGEVVSVSNQIPQFPHATTPQWASTTLVVDVTVRLEGGQEVTYSKLPANQIVADVQGTALVVSESRDAIVNELHNICKQHERELELVPHRQQMVTRCKEQIVELNPQAKVEAERDKELQAMRSEMAELKELLARALQTSTKTE